MKGFSKNLISFIKTCQYGNASMLSYIHIFLKSDSKIINLTLHFYPNHIPL